MVRFPAAVRDLSLLQSIQTVSEAHPASYPVGTRDSLSEAKQPGSETDHPFPLCDEVKNERIFISTTSYAFTTYTVHFLMPNIVDNTSYIN
jgi:hypothetical protein